MNRSTATFWKQGKSLPSQETVNKIADYFNVSLDYLMGRDNLFELKSGGVMYTADGVLSNEDGSIEKYFAKHGRSIPFAERETLATTNDDELDGEIIKLISSLRGDRQKNAIAYLRFLAQEQQGETK